MKPPSAHAPRCRFFHYSQSSSFWEKDISDRSLWILLLIHQGTWNMFRPTAGHYVSSFEYNEQNDGRILATLNTRINSSTEKRPLKQLQLFPHMNPASISPYFIASPMSALFCLCAIYKLGRQVAFPLKTIQRLQGLRLEARCSHRIWQHWSPPRWL